MQRGLRLAVTILLSVFLAGAAYPAAAAAAAFSDISRHWARDSITSIAALGYLNGYPDGTYRPDNTMTRAEFTTALIASLGTEQQYTITLPSNFNDTKDHWAKTQINEAVKRGILIPSEYPNGLQPDDAIKRSEVAAMLVRAKGTGTTTANIKFEDETAVEQSDYRDYIRTAYAQKLMSGFPDGEFKPFNNITRGQAATVLQTFLGISSPVSDPTPSAAEWLLVVGGNSYDLATTPFYFKSGYNDIKITSISSSGGRIIFNSTYSFPLDSQIGNPELVIHNTIYTVAKLSVSGNQLLISASASRLNNVTLGDHKYDASFVKLYINSTNGENYLGDAILRDQYTVIIDGKSYDLSRSKITIALGEKYYDIKKIIFSSTTTRLELAKTDAVISNGLAVSNITAILAGSKSIDMDDVKDIDFLVNHSMYSLSQVTIDGSGNFTANGSNYPCSEVTMIIDGSYYRINSITSYQGKFIIYAEPASNINRVLFEDEYHDASEIQIIRNNISYSLDQVMVVDRDLIRIGGKQYEVDSSIKCRFNNKIYDIDRIDYDTTYDIVKISATESKDYTGAYQPLNYMFYLNNAVYQDGINRNVTIYVNGAYRTFDTININDPGHFSYGNRTYDLIDSRVCIYNEFFTIIDTAWHGQSQTFDFYLKK